MPCCHAGDSSSRIFIVASRETKGIAWYSSARFNGMERRLSIIHNSMIKMIEEERRKSSSHVVLAVDAAESGSRHFVSRLPVVFLVRNITFLIKTTELRISDKIISPTLSLSIPWTRDPS